jgi:hypothetical protein
VVEKPEKDAASFICGMIRARFQAANSGIVYCQTRKECESLAQALAADGVSAASTMLTWTLRRGRLRIGSGAKVICYHADQ